MSYTIASDPSLSPPNGPAMISFMQSFYATSDTESRHDAYVDSFTDDATLIMGSKIARGSSEVLPLRHGLWTHVASRKHFPERIFFGGANELMLFGTVKYVLKADPSNEVEVPWAGRVVFDKTEGEALKMKFYQVYLDPTAQSGK
ncbi:hypothetical protein P170DRAFT_477630 [Aspergillus steynii IBT 23096]|uniref:SnoaL-like domain-containing protein n=1 Tax=Aspergillus steynii IBT 23096 TaxID=1392250 RepID=A0A2I2G1L5_9EURO|nr:uncharacterized protein P170DRAFT_477630 [Aspergillus steynii IBT 23096]PLB46760.1 hypothetical protein P170DRAFT_477630 [Aspergillus steynii IBT 23096]